MKVNKSIAIFIILQLVFVTTTVVVAQKAIDFKMCNMSVKYYSSIGMNHNDMMFTESDLQVCSKNVSVCCTRKIENNLHVLSMQEYSSLLNKYLVPVKALFIDYASNFDPKVKDILEECQLEFDEVFNKTEYTTVNRQSMFQQFFEGLKRFYGDYPVDVHQVIQKLFSNLTKLLFNIVNQSEHAIDEKCIDSHFNKIEPFGSILPAQITKQLIKSIDSVKIFTAGLTKLRDLIIDIAAKLQSPSISCKNSLTKMTKCSMCIHNSQTLIFNKINHIKPCYTYCLNVFKNCFVADLDQLDFIWNSHLNLMQKLSWIIENEINFGNTMSFFKLQISDAIAYYQSNSDIVNKKILYNCKTSLNSNSAVSGNKKKRMSLINNKLKALRRHSTKLLNLNVKLSDLFAGINNHYVSLTNYWNSLTLNICKSISGNHERCWNGTSLSNILDYQLNEDELDQESVKVNDALNATIWRQIENLKMFNDRIEKHIINDFDLENSIFFDDSSSPKTHDANNSMLPNYDSTKRVPLIVNNKHINDDEGEDDDEYEIEEASSAFSSGTNNHVNDDGSENSNEIIIKKVKEIYYDNISNTETLETLVAATTARTTSIAEEDEDEYYDNNVIKEYDDEEEGDEYEDVSTVAPRLRLNVNNNQFEFMKKQQSNSNVKSFYFPYTKNAASKFCKYLFKYSFFIVTVFLNLLN